MRRKKISETIGKINPNYITEAATFAMQRRTTRRPLWVRLGAVAACFAAVLIAGVLIIPTLNKGNAPISIGRIDRNYKDFNISGSESAIEWMWEYMTIYEKYPTITFDGREYRTRAMAISKSLLGESLGGCTADGFDSHTDKHYTETFDIYRIIGISEKHLIAVGMENEFYVYLRNDSTPPSTFGEFLDAYQLTQTLPFHRFSAHEDGDEKGYYIVNDDSHIWQILSECRDAKPVSTDSWNLASKDYLSFTATSEALGVYKRALYITADGYLWTNIFNYGYIYQIGEEAANKIITYATENATETEFEPYEYSLAGTLTEIGDGYLLLDDSILCVDQSEGMVFKVMTDDLRIRRCLEFGIEVGDTVVVKFTGAINVQEGNVIEGAYTLYKGTLIDGNVAIPE